MAAPGCNSDGSSLAQAIRVVDTIPTQPWSARRDASAHFLEQRWLDYTGLSREHALESGWKLAIHSDDILRLMEAFQEAVRRVHFFKVGGRFRRFDGEYRWFVSEETLCATKAETSMVRTNTDLEDTKRA